MSISVIVLLSTVVPIGAALLIVFGLLGRLKREQAETQRLLAAGMPAEGRVLAIAPTGTTVTLMGARHLRVLIGLQVQLPGRPPYQAQVTPLVSELMIPAIQPGAPVSLRVDPQNPMNIAIAGSAEGAQRIAPQPMAMSGQPYGYAQPYAPMAAGLAPGLAPQQFGRSGRFVLFMVLVTTLPVLGILAYVFYTTGLLRLP